MIDDDYGMGGVKMDTSADDNNNVDYKVITYNENGTHQVKPTLIPTVLIWQEQTRC